MKEKTIARLNFWAVLWNPIALAVYMTALRQLALLSRYGGTRIHLTVIAVCLGLELAWIIIWTVIYFNNKRKKKGRPLQKGLAVSVLCLEILFFTGVSLFYGKDIWNSAQPYNGKLSWKLREWRTSKTVDLKHNNIFKDGTKGIFTDLSEKINLPEDMYISNEFSVDFDENGTITGIYSFFYGKDSKGKDHTYLLDYNSNKSSKMTVDIDGYANCTYDETMKLQPFLTLTEAADIQNYAVQWKADYGSTQFELIYYGYRTFYGNEGVMWMDQDGKYHPLTEAELLQGQISGYEVSLYVPDNDTVVPIRFLNAREHLKHAQEETTSASQQKDYQVGTSAGNEFGRLYYLIDEKKGWQLRVVDAAAGSRFYALEQTLDGGGSWTRINEDPFLGGSGVAEGIVFFNSQLGFIGMSTASKDHSTLYKTQDGGNGFEPVKLPLHAASSDVADISTYDYVEMPVLHDNILTVVVRQEYGDNEKALVFDSSDNGQTWSYSGLKKVE